MKTYENILHEKTLKHLHKLGSERWHPSYIQNGGWKCRRRKRISQV